MVHWCPRKQLTLAIIIVLVFLAPLVIEVTVDVVTYLLPSHHSGDLTQQIAKTTSWEAPPQLTFAKIPEKEHVVYIRIPKTGSSTVTLLLWRYAWTRNLSVLAAHPHFTGTKKKLDHTSFFLPPLGVKYDIMAEHVLYDRESYESHFHEDTIYTTMLREPMSMLYSTLYYLSEFRTRISGEDKIASYLKNPTRYDRIAILAERSYTCNPQSSYLGLEKPDFNSTERIQQLIETTDMDFPVVMILEKLDESLILLRRLTNWPMKDLIYSKQNVNSKKPRLKITAKEREDYRRSSLADHLLYDYFSQKLDQQIAQAAPSFQAELDLFKKYQRDVSLYCRFETITDDNLYVPATSYHAEFTVNRKDCSLMNAEPLILISAIRKKQNRFPYMSLNLV